MDSFYSSPPTGHWLVTDYHSISVPPDVLVRNTDGEECWCIGNFTKLDLPILGDPSDGKEAMLGKAVVDGY